MNPGIDLARVARYHERRDTGAPGTFADRQAVRNGRLLVVVMVYRRFMPTGRGDG